MVTERRSFTIKAGFVLRQLVTPCIVAAQSDVPGAAARPPSRRYRSIWDTGATVSMVSQRVVDELNLPAEGFIKVRHAGGETAGVPTYYVDLLLYNNVQIGGVLVGLVHIRDIDVILGMDIISRGDFAVSNRGGATTFSFRIPSVENFDFVAADNIRGAGEPDA